MTANRLYFAQHGLAVDKTVDSQRPLSNDGIAQTHAVAKQLQARDIQLSTIFHSDKLRAQQTAQIFSSVLNVIDVREIKNLSPNDGVALIQQELNLNEALYIGHLPHLDKLISSLITDDENTHIIKFQNSGIACLEKNKEQYQLAWYLTPALTEC